MLIKNYNILIELRMSNFFPRAGHSSKNDSYGCATCQPNNNLSNQFNNKNNNIYII